MVLVDTGRRAVPDFSRSATSVSSVIPRHMQGFPVQTILLLLGGGDSKENHRPVAQPAHTDHKLKNICGTLSLTVLEVQLNNIL